MLQAPSPACRSSRASAVLCNDCHANIPWRRLTGGRHAWTWIWLLSTLLAIGMAAKAQDPALPESVNQEPIRMIPTSSPSDAPKVALGERLFHDPRLSGSGA